MIFDVRPYEGVGPLVLGMSPEDVHAVMGTPLRSAVRGGERIETYRDFTLAYSAANRLIEAVFSSSVDVRFENANLFTTPDALTRLVAADGAPLEGLGSIVFPALGVAVVDFDSDQESDRAVQAFERGRWDSITHLKPYTG
ncbi:MAG TPA: hypothetical protein VN153_07310 [Tahibacter sp.]|nr:hypothetical protein [Tahibacter sp.]